MICLKANNSSILKNTKFSFLSSNYVSGLVNYSVTSTSGFSADDYLLLGEIGSETSEIVQIQTVTNNTAIVLKSVTIFAHPESTRVTRVLYNQVRFYRTATATFSGGSPLGTVDIDPQSQTTKYEDSVNGTGFGWFIFLNETTGDYSQHSNAIPYGNFEPNSAKSIIDGFLSGLNNKQMILITFEDCFRYLSEAYSEVRKALNLVNQEYSTPALYPISITSGTVEYPLPSDFSRLVSVTDSDGIAVDNLTQKDVQFNNGSVTNTLKYFLRGTNIGFSPIPDSNSVVNIYYNSKTSNLTSYYDSIDLPNNEFYILEPYMMYKCSTKLGMPRQEGLSYLTDFNEKIKNLKISANKENSNLDSWGISNSSNI